MKLQSALSTSERDEWEKTKNIICRRQIYLWSERRGSVWAESAESGSASSARQRAWGGCKGARVGDWDFRPFDLLHETMQKKNSKGEAFGFIPTLGVMVWNTLWYYCMIHTEKELIRMQERTLQSDALNMQQEVAIKGIDRSLWR